MKAEEINRHRDIDWDGWFWKGVSCLFLFRILYVALFPFDLAGDETYYWDWGRHLDWGYFSKPPLIGWLMGLAGWVGGDSPFGIRVFAVLLGTGSLIILFLLGRRLYGSRTSFWAATAMAACPGNAALNLLLTIDAPLLFFWSGGLYAFWQLLMDEKHRTTWGLALILALGLGSLSKQMTLVFFVSGILFLATTREYRRLLKRPVLWFGLFAALAFMIPSIWWNARHNWITFQHTAHHFEPASLSLSEILLHPATFIGTQLLLISPVTWILLMGLMITCLFAYFRLGPKERFLFLFSGPPLIFVLLMTLRQKINGNWPAAFYPSGVMLLAAWATDRFETGSKFGKSKRAFRPGIGVGVILALVTYGVPIAVSTTGLKGSRLDPLIRLEGWSGLAQEVAHVRSRMPHPKRTFVMTVGHRYLTSGLAFYLPDQPRVYRWVENGRIQSQYEIWGAPKGKQGWDCLIVIKRADAKVPSQLRQRFSETRKLKNLHVPLGSGKARKYTLFLGLNWKEPFSESILIKPEKRGQKKGCQVGEPSRPEHIAWEMPPLYHPGRTHEETVRDSQAKEKDTPFLTLLPQKEKWRKEVKPDRCVAGWKGFSFSTFPFLPDRQVSPAAAEFLDLSGSWPSPVLLECRVDHKARPHQHYQGQKEPNFSPV